MKEKTLPQLESPSLSFPLSFSLCLMDSFSTFMCLQVQSWNSKPNNLLELLKNLVNMANCQRKDTYTHVTYLSHCLSRCMFFLLRSVHRWSHLHWAARRGRSWNQAAHAKDCFNGKSERKVTCENCSWTKSCYWTICGRMINASPKSTFIDCEFKSSRWRFMTSWDLS